MYRIVLSLICYGIGVWYTFSAFNNYNIGNVVSMNFNIVCMALWFMSGGFWMLNAIDSKKRGRW